MTMDCYVALNMQFEPGFHVRKDLLAIRVVKDFMVKAVIIFQGFVF
jgi:hypothetical protein